MIVYPQVGIAKVCIYKHAASTKHNASFSYEEVVKLLDEIEEGILEQRCDSNELDQITHLLTNLAIEGMLPGNFEEAFALEQDTEEILYLGEDLYQYASWQSAISYDHGEILLCKTWWHKKWDQLKKYAKKHKKEILIGAAVAAGVAIAVAAVVAVSGAGAAAAVAGAAGAAGALGARDSEKDVSSDELPSPINLSPEINSRQLKSAVQEEVSTLKEWVANEDFMSTDFLGFPIEENGRLLRDVIALHSLENTSDRSCFAELYQLRGERALELNYYDQAIADFGKVIELNPDNHEAYLDRAFAHLQTGAHQRSLEDYLQYSARKPSTVERIVELSENVLDFTSGFERSLSKGIKTSTLQLVSFAHQAVIHPIDTLEEIYTAFEVLFDLTTSQEWSTIAKTLIPEVCELVTKWDTLSPKEQGEVAGYTLGKLGGDVFIPGTSTKVASAGIKGAKELALACKILKNAEKTLTLEALAQSVATSEVLAEASAQLHKAESAALASKELSVASGVERAFVSEFETTRSLEKTIGSSFESLINGRAFQGLTFDQQKQFLTSAIRPYNENLTQLAHSFSKHAGRHPETWGKLKGSMDSWHYQAIEQLKDICNASGSFAEVIDPKTGLIWIEKRLPDGRGVRLNYDYTFKGFVD